MITDIVWTDDRKLLQGNYYLKAPITLHISLQKRRRLASEGLVNLTRDTGSELRSASTTRQDVDYK